MLQILSYQSWSLDPTFGAPIQVVHNLVVHTLGPIEPPPVHGGFCRQEPHHLRKLTKEKRDPFQGFHINSQSPSSGATAPEAWNTCCRSSTRSDKKVQRWEFETSNDMARLCRVHQHRSCNCWCHGRCTRTSRSSGWNPCYG